jgi:hypothetical protein
MNGTAGLCVVKVTRPHCKFSTSRNTQQDWTSSLTHGRSVGPYVIVKISDDVRKIFKYYTMLLSDWRI